MALSGELTLLADGHKGFAVVHRQKRAQHEALALNANHVGEICANLAINQIVATLEQRDHHLVICCCTEDVEEVNSLLGEVRVEGQLR